MSEKKFVTYLEFGAVGDGKTNDYYAIKRAHEYANENNIPVKLSGDYTYYIGDTEIDGKGTTITVKTDVDWGGSKFIIDDNVFPLDGITTLNKHYMHIFKVESDYEMSVIDDREILDRLVREGFDTKTVKISLALGYPAMIIPHNAREKVYRRKGYGGHNGYDMKEVVVIDKDGNLDPETPIMFDYKNLDTIDVYRLDIKPLTLENATFTTLANNECAIYVDDAGRKRFRDIYFKRGINVNRSLTTVRNVKHYVEGQISPLEQKEQLKLCVGYYGFFATTLSHGVTYEDCVVTARRCFTKNPAGVGSGTQGTYDIHNELSNKTVFKNCVQTNFWVNDNAEPVSEDTPGAKLSMATSAVSGLLMYWGIGASNDCKNMEYYGCTLSRFDAHRGLYSGKVIDSTVNCVSIVGGGNMVIENSRWFSEGPIDKTNSLVFIRSDYGCPWDGTITIKNVKAYPMSEAPLYLVFNNYTNWDYGYPCKLPTITVENLECYDIATREPMGKGYEVHLLSPTRSIMIEPALRLTRTLNMHPWFDDILNPKNYNGLEDTGSFANVNPITPFGFVKVLNNKGEYAYVIPDTYTYKGMGKDGFLENTKFYYTENEYYEGTNHVGESTKTFKFVTLE